MSLSEKISEIDEFNVDKVYPRTQYSGMEEFQELGDKITEMPKAVNHVKTGQRTPALAHLVSSRQVEAIKQRKGI